VLPDDGDAHHGPIPKTYKTHFEDAGFEVEVIPTQGPGAAMMRIEALRRAILRSVSTYMALCRAVMDAGWTRRSMVDANVHTLSPSGNGTDQ
jgi:protein tyrosine phosphatase (PTP) superfamily phosphohydrolase (DUF442 family)